MTQEHYIIMLNLLKEEVKYLDHWIQSFELPPLLEAQMKERKSFILPIVNEETN